MEKIKNYEVYTSRMQKSMYDKMFFVDKIFEHNIDTIIDFGCADGELILHLHQFMPEVRFIGYDIDETMLEKAREKVPFAEFYSDWNAIIVNPKTTLLNLSSVVHEVFFYSCPIEIKTFWENILTQNFAYIAVRDMFRSQKVRPVNQEWIDIIQNTKYSALFEKFVKHWGTPCSENDVMHFLLKYRYVENWDRELAENYFPINKEDFVKHFSEYSIAYEKYDSLPFLVAQIKKDFNIDAKDVPTHYYLILKHNK